MFQFKTPMDNPFAIFSAVVTAIFLEALPLDAAAYRAFGARWVGGAMAHCLDDLPWWRVINAQGRISDRPSAAQGKGARHVIPLF